MGEEGGGVAQLSIEDMASAAPATSSNIRKVAHRPQSGRASPSLYNIDTGAA